MPFSGGLEASLVVQSVKNLPAMQETWVGSLGLDREDPLEKAWLPTPVFLPAESHGHRNTKYIFERENSR